jgi:hypothetical protein
MADEGGGGALRSLLAYFRISVNSEELKKADDKIGEFVEKLGKLGSGIIWGEIAKKSLEFFRGQVEGAAHLQDVSEKLNIGVDQLKAFGFAAKAAGIDFDSAAFMLGRFQRALGGAGKGGAGTAAELKKLGINAKEASKKDTVEVMLDLADAFKKMPTQAEKTAAAVRLFGRSGIAMVPILSKGREALEEMFKESKELGSGLGGDFYKGAKQAREEFEHFEFAITSLKERALAPVLPYIIKVGSWLKDSAKTVIEFTKHTNVLKTGILFLAAGLAYKLIPALYSSAKALGLLEAEVLLPLVGIGLLYLAFDELWTLMNGGDTVIGRLIDRFFGIGTAADLAKNHSEALGFAAEASAVLIITAFNPVLGLFAALALAIKTVNDEIEKAKYANETAAEHQARVERESPENKALFAKAQAAQQKRQETDREDYKSGKKKGVEQVGKITFGDQGPLSDADKAYNIIHAREAGTPIPFTPYVGTAPRIPIPGGAGSRASGATAIHNEQKNDVRINVTTDSNQPREVATTLRPVVERALKEKYNTLTARTQP